MTVKLSDLNPAQRIAYVEHQVFEAEKGHIDIIECPYCGVSVNAGSRSLCCEQMGEAVAAVLLKMECRDQLDEVARIADGAERSLLVH